jgi:hypothetical protein
MPVGIRLSLSFKETEYLVKGSPLLPNIRGATNSDVSNGVSTPLGGDRGTRGGA